MAAADSTRGGEGVFSSADGGPSPLPPPRRFFLKGQKGMMGAREGGFWKHIPARQEWCATRVVAER